MNGLQRMTFLACALLISFSPTARTQARPAQFYFGADLSFANEMDDCGAEYRLDGQRRDVFDIFHATGHNLARLRIWIDPDWTKYSTIADVRRSIRRAHQAGMQVLLDFHYSDDWADGEKQWIPRAWENISSTEELAQRLRDYTFDTLMALDRDGLMPDMVQVGNETNKEILGRHDWDWAHRGIDWARNAALLNAGIRAVREAGQRGSKAPTVMLHIAQPENVALWFEDAGRAGVSDYDMIGISYYRKWSSEDLDGLGQSIARLHALYPAKQIILVETAYPWTTDHADDLGNILGAPDTLNAHYPATPEGQERYMIDVTQLVISNGGSGVVTWAPDWVSTGCATRWGQGSSWENATFFDFHHNNEATPAIRYPQHNYRWATADIG